MKIKKFNEANINLKELDKTSKDGLRGDTLVKKIKNHDRIQFKPPNEPSSDVVIKNDKVIVKKITDKKGKYNSERAKDFFTNGRYYSNVIEGEDDEMYRLNDISKTKDFGGGGGTSLGTEATRDVECIQCLFLALRQTKGEDSITRESVNELYDVNNRIRQDLILKIRVPINITSELIDKYSNWLDSFINTANALYEVRPIFTEKKNSASDNVLSRRKKYIFYQIGYNSELTEVICKKFRSFKSTKGIPIAKWTPSDIWAISTQLHRTIIRSIEECNTIEELNNKVDIFFDQKNLRGISLKKLKTIEKTDDVKLVLNKVTPVPSFDFNMVVTSKNALGSLGVRVIVNQSSSIESENIPQFMDVRTFGGQEKPGDISGEVIGESARHGKVGLTVINKNINIVAKELGIRIETIETKNELSDKTDSFLTSEIEKLNKIISEKGKSVGTSSSKTNRARLISKYQALKFAELLYNNKRVSDVIIQKIFYYAMAIRNDAFESPKYVRII